MRNDVAPRSQRSRNLLIIFATPLLEVAEVFSATSRFRLTDKIDTFVGVRTGSSNREVWAIHRTALCGEGQFRKVGSRRKRFWNQSTEALA